MIQELIFSENEEKLNIDSRWLFLIIIKKRTNESMLPGDSNLSAPFFYLEGEDSLYSSMRS